MAAMDLKSKLDAVRGAVLVESEKLEGVCDKVSGYDFNKGVDFEALLNTYKYTGFQATSVGKAIDEINKMV